MKDVLKKHLITILCAISIVAVFLPFVTLDMSVTILGATQEGSYDVTGLMAAEEGIVGYLLLVGPILLIAMNYIRQLDRYKSLLIIAVPAVCLVVSIVDFFQARALGLASSGGGSFGMDFTVLPGIGFILAIISYIATAIAGAKIYHNLDLSNITLDKAGLERLKEEGKQVVSSVQESISQAAQAAPAPSMPMEPVQTATGTAESQAKVAAPARPAAPRAPVKKPLDMQRTEGILAMIEKLAQMKDAGILTDEEFTEKKRQLLSEIQV